MTTIVAYLDKDGCYFGSDTQMMDSTDGPVEIGKKWILWEDSAFGIAGNWPVLNLLDSMLPSTSEILKGPWDLIEKIKKVLEDADFSFETKQGFKDWDCWGLYVTATQLWEISDLFAVRELEPDVMHSIGTGSDAARGGDYVFEAVVPMLSPELRVRNAIETAIAIDYHSGMKVWYNELLV